MMLLALSPAASHIGHCKGGMHRKRDTRGVDEALNGGLLLMSGGSSRLAHAAEVVNRGFLDL